MEEGEAGCGWESPYGRVHEMEREREGAREQGEGGGGYPPTERGERRQPLPVAKDSGSLGGLGSRERLGTTPRSQEAELGSWVLLPNPGGGQERPKRKDKEEETRWGGWGFSLGRGHRASREPRGGLRMTDKASGNQMC